MFLDENPKSINDRLFQPVPQFHQRPARGESRQFHVVHLRQYGHAQLHKWVDTYLLPTGGSTSSQDHQWLVTHATIPN